MATVTVENRPGHTFTTTVTASEHTMLADEPTADGGDGLGPTPYELLLAALGSCTVMTLELYARRKAWPLESVRVDLSFDRIHELDSERCDEMPTRIDRIVRTFTFGGSLSEDQRDRLLEIAARCPVHRTIMGAPRIVDVMADPMPTMGA